MGNDKSGGVDGALSARAFLQLRADARESEAAASSLEVPSLRLEMIQLRVIVLNAEAYSVLPMNPAEIGIADVLIVSENERIPGAGIAQVRESAKLKGGLPSLEWVRSIRSGNSENI